MTPQDDPQSPPEPSPADEPPSADQPPRESPPAEQPPTGPPPDRTGFEEGRKGVTFMPQQTADPVDVSDHVFDVPGPEPAGDGGSDSAGAAPDEPPAAPPAPALADE